jgi:hypothetical protein
MELCVGFDSLFTLGHPIAEGSVGNAMGWSN